MLVCTLVRLVPQVVLNAVLEPILRQALLGVLLVLLVVVQIWQFRHVLVTLAMLSQEPDQH